MSHMYVTDPADFCLAETCEAASMKISPGFSNCSFFKAKFETLYFIIGFKKLMEEFVVVQKVKFIQGHLIQYYRKSRINKNFPEEKFFRDSFFQKDLYIMF